MDALRKQLETLTRQIAAFVETDIRESGEYMQRITAMHDNAVKLKNEILRLNIKTLPYLDKSDGGAPVEKLYLCECGGELLANGIVRLTIYEVLPHTKAELSAFNRERWNLLVCRAMEKAGMGGALPFYEKAFVGIDIAMLVSPSGQLWDVSNRAVNLVLNVLKGTFMMDDDITHLAIMLNGRVGATGETTIYIGDFYLHREEITNLTASKNP